MKQTEETTARRAASRAAAHLEGLLQVEQRVHERQQLLLARHECEHRLALAVLLHAASKQIVSE
eukprot:scaffold56399_cov54-Phaeocystis_antarctica.AAC.2